MFWIILIVAVVAIFIYIKNDIEKDAQRKKTEAKNAEKAKERELELFEAKANKVYMNSISDIYDDMSVKQLEQIHSLLTTMHYNDYNVGEDGFSKQTCSSYYDAKEDLLRIVGHNRWKRLLKNGEIQQGDHIINATKDMNYVYNLLNYRR